MKIKQCLLLILTLSLTSCSEVRKGRIVDMSKASSDSICVYVIHTNSMIDPYVVCIDSCKYNILDSVIIRNDKFIKQ